MNLPPTSGRPADDRRTVPRHLRDVEHEATPETSGAGRRRGDVPMRRGGRGAALLVVAAAALAAGLWLGATVPLGIACLAAAAVAAVLASLSFRRR